MPNSTSTAPNRFSAFTPTADLLARQPNRADVLALLDALGLSLVQRAYQYESKDASVATMLGEAAQAVQDARFELYSRMVIEHNNAGQPNYVTVAQAGAANTIRNTLQPYGQALDTSGNT